MNKRLIWYLVGLALVDVVIPVPILAILAIYVIVKRPPWFLERVHEVYHGAEVVG